MGIRDLHCLLGLVIVALIEQEKVADLLEEKNAKQSFSQPCNTVWVVDVTRVT